MSKLGFWGDFETKIVCNELRRQELLSVSDWIHDASDCAARFSPITYQGYCLWAKPCRQMVRKSPWFARRVATVVRWMVADIRYQKGLSSQSHLLGRVVRQALFWPGNWLLGSAMTLLRSDISVSTLRARESFVQR